MNEIVKIIGQEWVFPNDEMALYAGFVAIQTNCGTLLLARVEQVIDGPNAGEIRRVLVKPEELFKL